MNDGRHVGKSVPTRGGATIVDLAAARRARMAPQMPWAACGSASYHEAAIKQDSDARRGA